MLWKVRFKFRQMMETHVIETLGSSQEEADALAEAYLGEAFGTPNIRLVPPVMPFVSQRTNDIPALALKYGPIAPTGTPMPATPPIAEPPAAPAQPAVPEPVPEPAPTPMTAEEADAADEDAMAPRVAKGSTPKPGSKQRIGA